MEEQKKEIYKIAGVAQWQSNAFVKHGLKVRVLSPAQTIQFLASAYHYLYWIWYAQFMNKERYCANCGVTLNVRHKIKYCSNKCQTDLNYRMWVSSWKNGKETGNIGITSGNISGHLRRYLLEKFFKQMFVVRLEQKTSNHPSRSIRNRSY